MKIEFKQPTSTFKFSQNLRVKCNSKFAVMSLVLVRNVILELFTVFYQKYYRPEEVGSAVIQYSTGILSNFVPKHQIDLTKWLRSALLVILIVFILKIMITLFRKLFWTFRTGPTIAINDNINSKQIKFTVLEETTISKKTENVKNAVISKQRMQSNTSNEFSTAHKYLCTCEPGNAILARRPIHSK